jgi:hypothetical protein
MEGTIEVMGQSGTTKTTILMAKEAAVNQRSADSRWSSVYTAKADGRSINLQE